ncbi:ribonuclease H-like domain-containing protein [Tanacetum coccineum]
MFVCYNDLYMDCAWFQRFAGYATRAGFYHSPCDSLLFICRLGSQVAYLLIYVDDIILTASSASLLQQIIVYLHREFDMTDLGPLNYFLGISADGTPTGLFLSQRQYALQLLKRAHMVNCNPSRTPVDTENWVRRDLSLYAQPEGASLCYSKAYFELCSGTVDFASPLSSATLVYCDNVSAVYLSANPDQHQRTKHIEIDIHFVRDMVIAGHVRVLHVPSRYQFADIFTKGLPSVLFEEFRASLSVRLPPAPTAGAY